MGMTNEEHLQMVREYEEEKHKVERLGGLANVLVQMYLREPARFSAEFMMSQLVEKHVEIGFDEIKSRGDEEN